MHRIHYDQAGIGVGRNSGRTVWPSDAGRPSFTAREAYSRAGQYTVS